MTYANLPLGKIRAHTLEVIVNRRFANGLSGFASFSANSVRENRTVRSSIASRRYGKAVTGGVRGVWQGAAVYELPFGQSPVSGCRKKRRFAPAATGRSAARGSSSRGHYSIGAEPVLLRRPRRYQGGRPDARALVQHRRGLRERSDENTRPVPGAGRSRSGSTGCAGRALTFTNLSISAQFPRRRQPHVASGASTRRNIFNRQQWQGTVRRSDQYPVRPGHQRRAQPDALLQLRRARAPSNSE